MIKNKEKKSFQRTIRMSDRVKIVLETYEGNGMNEKFENLVLDSNYKLPEIEEQIQYKQLELKNLENKIKELSDMHTKLKDIEYNLHLVQQISNTL